MHGYVDDDFSISSSDIFISSKYSQAVLEIRNNYMLRHSVRPNLILVRHLYILSWKL